MTILTLPARSDAGDARLAPIPWRRMIWVTWRQHRAAFLGVVVVLAAAAVFQAAYGLKIHHDYAALTACRGSAGNCQVLNSLFNSTDWHVADAVNIVMQLVPVLLGMFAGAPVLARDLEAGTFRFAWTQGIGRERWTIAKLAFFGVPVAVVAAALGALHAWFMAPILPQESMTVMSAGVFDSRGIAFPAWTLAAFMLGAFAGMLLRRIVPAMAVTMGAYLVLAVVTWVYLRPNYPVTGFWPSQLFEGAWLVAASAALIAGTVWLARRRAA
jgi:hypothetical protein